jgi:DNA-binding GntR family transcriptional regulator
LVQKETARLVRQAPLYERASDVLLAFIAENGYQPGDRLPGEHSLAEEVGVSRNTLREAMSELRNMGLVERRQGAGTFVIASPSVLRPGLETLSGLPNIAGRPDVDLRRTSWSVDDYAGLGDVHHILRLESVEPVLVVRMAAAADGVNAATFESWIAEKYVDRAAVDDFEDGSLLDYLVLETDVRLTNTWSEVSAISAETELAEWLGVARGTSLLRLSETFYTRSGDPIVHSLNHFLTNKVAFHIIRKMSIR